MQKPARLRNQTVVVCPGLENFMVARDQLSRFLELTRQSQAVNGKRKHYVRPPAQNQGDAHRKTDEPYS